MKPDRKPPKPPTDSGPITAANWVARAQAHIAARGGQGLVIRTAECKSAHAKDYPPTEAQWRAWLAYLDGLGVPTAFVRSHGLMTVPTEWPEQFDPSAPMSDYDYRPPAKTMMSDYRPQLARMFRDLADRLPSAEKRGPKPMSPADRMAYLDSLKDQYEANPIGDCSDLMK